MKPFSLGTVLKYRKRLEDEAAGIYTRSRLELQQAIATFNRAVDIREQLILKLEEKQRLGIDASELARFDTHLSYQKSKIDKLEDTVKKKRKISKTNQEILLNKTKERKILETLKENQNEAWKHHINKKETAMLDEIAVIFHDRKTY